MTAKELQQTFGALCWRLSFPDFCRRLGISDGEAARELWKAMHEVARGLGQFEVGQLDALLSEEARP